MLKSLNNILVVFIAIIIFFSCSEKKNNTIKNSQDSTHYSDTLNNSNSINDFFKLAKNELSNPYSNIIIKNSNYDYGPNEYSINKNLKNILFSKDTINFISFTNNNIDNLIFINCIINGLTITSSHINNLKIKNCKVNSLEIISSPFNQIKITSHFSDTIKKIIIKNCKNSKNIFFAGNFKEITFDGGQINNLDITKINSRNTKVQIMSTELLYPNFYDNRSTNVDVFSKATITSSSFGSNFILNEERELLKINSHKAYDTNRGEIFNRFRFVEQSYDILSQKLKNSNNKQLSNYFIYRKNKIHNLLNQDYVWNKLSVIWNEYFRGNYGSSISPIIYTFLISWLIFAIIFLILGYLNFILFYYKITNDEGKTNKTSHYLTFNKKLNNFTIYLRHCIWFSLSQMVAGSVINSLNFGRFTTLYLTPPRKYYTVGLGIFFSIIQNIIGIILIFNFVSTFINISLK
jgi:hypothetical protein